MRPCQDEESNDNRTVYCGNISENVTDSVLFQLFQQAGPVESVRRPRDPNQRPKSFAFIVYKHEVSVPYALEIFRGTKLFNRPINLNSRSTLKHVPVLDTHITEFTEPRGQAGHEGVHIHETKREDIRRERSKEVCVQESEPRMYQNREENRRQGNVSDNHRRDNYNQNRHSQRGKDPNEPKSWTEYNALHGKNLGLGNMQSDLQRNPERQRESSTGLQMPPDFNSLIQMGGQMLLPPGCTGMGGFPAPNMMHSMGGFGPGHPVFRENCMSPIMPGIMDGREMYSHERDRGRRDNHDRRGSRRDHPYNDQGRYDHREDQRRHDRGYTSSRSSHDRERRDRRSR